MITFDRDEFCFNYRVAAIAIQNNKVLLHKYEGFDFWALPGGRAELDEHSITTIKREMKEELDEDINVERLLFINESRFEHLNKEVHELALYYLVSFNDNSEVIKATEAFDVKEIDGTTLTFKWFNLSEVSELELYPEFLRTRLNDLPEHIEQIFTGFEE
jgi:ADP-ribose pyrophosphatase YjhB (NUDIX family)